MRSWYSPRGARRGLLLAAMTIALWIFWAIGYTQAVAGAVRPSVTSATQPTQPSDVVCCTPSVEL